MKDIKLKLFAQTASFTRNIKQAGRAVAGIGKGVISSGIGGVGKIFMGAASGALGAAKAFAKFAIVGVAAAGAALAIFIKNTMSTIDETAKLSARVGMSTQNLIAYGHAAGKAGVEQEQFADSMKDFNKNLGKMKLDGNVAAFDALGLSQEKMINLSTDEALNLVADGLANVADGNMRASLAQDIFGEGGFKMLPLLSQGSAGLRSQREEAERLGLSYNKIDAAKIETANDSLMDMGSAVKGIFTKLTILLAPAIGRFAKYATAVFVNFRKNILPVLINFVKTSVVAFRGFLKIALPVFITFARGVYDLAMFMWDGVKSVFNFIGQAFGFFGDDTEGAGDTFENFAERIKSVINFARVVFANFGDFVGIAMNSVLKSISGLVLGAIGILKDALNFVSYVIPGVGLAIKGLEKIEDFVLEVNVGSTALMDEGVDEMHDKFVKFNKAQNKETKDAAKDYMHAFDSIMGFGELDINAPDALAIKIDPVDLKTLENTKLGLDDDGLDSKTTTAKPQELKALKAGSIEAFKLINNQPEKERELSLLRKIADGIADMAAKKPRKILVGG